MNLILSVLCWKLSVDSHVMPIKLRCLRLLPTSPISPQAYWTLNQFLTLTEFSPAFRSFSPLLCSLPASSSFSRADSIILKGLPYMFLSRRPFLNTLLSTVPLPAPCKIHGWILQELKTTFKARNTVKIENPLESDHTGESASFPSFCSFNMPDTFS